METAGPEGRHLWKAGHRIRVYLGLHTRRAADDAQPHPSLAHERITVRQERQTEWMRQPSGDDGDFQPVLLGRVEGVRSGGQRHRGDADLRLPLLGGQGHCNSGERHRTCKRTRHIEGRFYTVGAPPL